MKSKQKWSIFFTYFNFFLLILFFLYPCDGKIYRLSQSSVLHKVRKCGDTWSVYRIGFNFELMTEKK